MGITLCYRSHRISTTGLDKLVTTLVEEFPTLPVYGERPFRRRAAARRALARSQFLLVLIDTHWLDDLDTSERDLVRATIVEGLAQRTWILPILMEHTLMPRPAELPEDLRSLAHRKPSRLRASSELTDLPGLVARLRALGAPGPNLGVAPRRRRTRVPRPRTDPVLLRVVAVTLVVGAGVTLLSGVWFNYAFVHPSPPEWTGPPPDSPPQPPFVIAPPKPAEGPPAFFEKASAKELMAAARERYEQNTDFDEMATLALWSAHLDDSTADFYEVSRMAAIDGRIDPAIYWLQRAALEQGVVASEAHHDIDLLSLRLQSSKWREISPFLVAAEAYRQGLNRSE